MGSRATHAALVGTLLACAWAAGCGGVERGAGDRDSGAADEGGAASGSVPSGTSPGSPSGSSSGSSSGGGGAVEAGPVPVTCTAALAQLSSCMTYADFTAKNASGYSASDLGNWLTSRSGACSSCHSQGDGGFCVSANPSLMFQMIQQSSCIGAWVGETCDGSGDVTGFSPSSIIPDEGNGSQCMQGTPCHPAYQLPAGLVAAMDAFVNDAIARWQAGQCSTAAPADGGGD